MDNNKLRRAQYLRQQADRLEAEARAEDLQGTAYKNAYEAMFDGLKYVADPDNPIPLTLPMVVKANLIYIYNEVRYVALEDTLVTEDNMADVMAEY